MSSKPRETTAEIYIAVVVTQQRAEGLFVFLSIEEGLHAIPFTRKMRDKEAAHDVAQRSADFLLDLLEQARRNLARDPTHTFESSPRNEKSVSLGVHQLNIPANASLPSTYGYGWKMMTADLIDQVVVTAKENPSDEQLLVTAAVLDHLSSTQHKAVVDDLKGMLQNLEGAG